MKATTVMKELSEKSYVWITSTANHEFAILLTKKEHSHNQLINISLMKKAGNWIPKK
jgi:hypothetical protein